MKVTLGFSPCPNDTFIFDALVNNLIETGDLEFELVMEDVETLNRWSLEQKLDITKLSFGVLPLVESNYQLLDSGSALGKGVGPLLISKHQLNVDDIQHCKVLIPGKHTTAHMLFSQAFPDIAEKQFCRYDQVQDLLLSSGEDLLAGVIIHENRFTYQNLGLKLIADLGSFWEEKTGLPIPLGGIVANRKLPPDVVKRIEQLIKLSIDFSWKRYPDLSDFIRDNAQEMSEDVMRKHIELYVNEFSLSLGEEGSNAVEKFREVYAKSV